LFLLQALFMLTSKLFSRIPFHPLTKEGATSVYASRFNCFVCF